MLEGVAVAVGNANPGLQLACGAGTALAARGTLGCGQVSVQRVLRHGKIITLASECFSPKFPFAFKSSVTDWGCLSLVCMARARSLLPFQVTTCHQVSPSLALAVGQALPILLHPWVLLGWELSVPRGRT